MFVKHDGINRIPVFISRANRTLGKLHSYATCGDTIRKVFRVGGLNLTVMHQIRKLTVAAYKGIMLNFRHRASCILGQAFRYSPENAFYIFNQQIYFII